MDKEAENDIISLLKNIAHQENKCVIIISRSTKVQEVVDQCYHLVNGKIESI